MSINDKWHFKEIGESVEIFEPISIIMPESVSIKNSVRLSEMSVLMGGRGLYIGNFVHIASLTTIGGGGYCVLEDFTGVCAGTRIITGSDDIHGGGIPSPLVPAELRSVHRSFVHCQQHTFLGTGCIIHPGVTIGEGAVVGSGSVVTKSLDPWGIYIGAPARRVKDRPRDKVLELAQRAYDIRGITPSDFSEVLAFLLSELASGVASHTGA